MKALFVILISISFLWAFQACKSGSVPPTLCDTSCLKDSIIYTEESSPLKPYVYISAANCLADTIGWGHLDMGSVRKIGIAGKIETAVKLNKSGTSCFIKDTSYAWLAFNDCSTGRGYLVKIPFSKKESISWKSSAINNLDPKFAVDPSLVASTDRGNIFIEDKATGKSASMTFGERVEIDYDHFHDYLDSVNITPTRIWAKVKLGKDWKELEKAVELK
jgi:hypothetical protein